MKWIWTSGVATFGLGAEEAAGIAGADREQPLR